MYFLVIWAYKFFIYRANAAERLCCLQGRPSDKGCEYAIRRNWPVYWDRWGLCAGREEQRAENEEVER